MRITGPAVPAPSKSVDDVPAGIAACGQPVASRRPAGPLRYRGRNMAEPRDDLSGMGSTPRGPAFVPSAAAPDTGPEPMASARPAPIGPPRSVRPTVISILVIAFVAAVVAGASVFAYWGDTHVAAPTRAPVPPPAYTSPADRIDFDSSEGSGQLIMRTRTWVSDTQVPPTSGQYLRLELELVCTEGEVDYDPYLFQAFDQSGQLFEMAVDGAGRRLLSVGTLSAGEQVQGAIAFDIPRGEVTLLMSDDSDNTVTALRNPSSRAEGGRVWRRRAPWRAPVRTRSA